MLAKEIQKLLEYALLRLGYDVQYELLDEGKGGSYRLREQKRVIIDSRLAPDEKIGILIDILKEMDTSGLYLPPAVRCLLDDDGARGDW